MKIKIAFLLLLLSFISCDKTKEENFCNDCTVKTDALQVVENKIGLVVFDENYNKYLIEVAHYNDPVYYVPCQIPAYYDPYESQIVTFSGLVTCDPLIKGDPIKTTLYCIKLDTIYGMNQPTK
jgi:hypothetical protein